MMVKVYTLSSFTKNGNGGNPAGVVIHADGLSESAMRKIAGIIGFSETAFVMKSNLADFKLRFFTPDEEVDLCGHATVAAFYMLANKGLITPGLYSQETKAGVLHVDVHEDFTVMMEQNAPIFSDFICKEEIADSLNIPVEDIPDDLPVQIVSTGLRDILIPVKDIAALNSIKPDFKIVSEISKKYHAVGYHVFTLETLHSSQAHCRNFAPLYGIPEESATGTSNGALACYLYKYGEISNGHLSRIPIEQGYSMEKPSEIIAALTIRDKEIVKVKIGGKASNLSEVEIDI